MNLACDLFKEQKDENGIAACGICMGFLYRSNGEIDLALKYGLSGLDQLERTNSFPMFQIMGCYWLGGLYTETGHLKEALQLFQKGLQINFTPGIKALGPRMVNGLAGVYMKQKNYTLALENYEKALAQSDGDSEYTFHARGLTDLGDYHLVMGNYEEAIQYNLEALDIRQQLHIQNGCITNLTNLGSIYQMQGKLKEAIEVLKKALLIAEEIGVKSKMYQIHLLLSNIYLGMGNVTDSLAHHKAYHEIKETVNHEDMDRKVKNQVQIFEAQLTQKENAIIKAQKIEIENKNIKLQETIDELTLTRINKKAKVYTLGIAIILFIFEEQIIHGAIHLFANDNYFLTLFIKIVIIFSLKPIDESIEKFLLRKVIKKKKLLE